MNASSKSSPDKGSPERPDFAVALGLLPPYAMDDVKLAYLEKVKSAHPDHGGSRDDFDRIQEAYDQACQYLRFRTDRRQWISARMDEYLAVEELTGQLRKLGAEVDARAHDWVGQSFGDFADLTEAIEGVRLADSQNVAEVLDILVREQENLPALKRLEVPGCPVDDTLAGQLRVFKRLTHLDLSRTNITSGALRVVEWMPALVSLNIEGTKVGWWARRKLNRLLRRRKEQSLNPLLHPANIGANR